MAAGTLPPAGRPAAGARTLGALAAGLTLVLGAASGVSFETQFLRAGLAGAAFAVLGWLAGAALGYVDTSRPPAAAGTWDGEVAGSASGRRRAGAGAPAAPTEGGGPGSRAGGRGRIMDVLVEDDRGPDVRRN